MTQFQDILGLFLLAYEFDQINPSLFPDQTVRVSLKEDIISRMSKIIISTKIPLSFIGDVMSNTGLKVAFIRAIGESAPNDEAPNLLSFIEEIAIMSGPEDWNLKWQIVRAYRTLHRRFSDQEIVTSALATSGRKIAHVLKDHEDASLTAGVAAMEEALGIA